MNIPARWDVGTRLEAGAAGTRWWPGMGPEQSGAQMDVGGLDGIGGQIGSGTRQK